MPNFTNPPFYLGHHCLKMYIVLTHCPFPPENFKEIYFYFYLHVCVSVSLFFRPKEDVRSPGAGITAPQCGCWELNSLFLEERCTLLTAEPSLQQWSRLFISEYEGSCHMFSSVAVAKFSFSSSYSFCGIMIWGAEVAFLCYWVHCMVTTFWLENSSRVSV